MTDPYDYRLQIHPGTRMAIPRGYHYTALVGPVWAPPVNVTWDLSYATHKVWLTDDNDNDGSVIPIYEPQKAVV